MLKLNSDRYMSVFNLPAAGLVISQIPIVILFIFAYRRIFERQLRRRGQGLEPRRTNEGKDCQRMAQVSLIDVEKHYGRHMRHSRISIWRSRTASSPCWSDRRDAARPPRCK